MIMENHSAGWSSLVARWAHNPKVAGSNPAPATNLANWVTKLGHKIHLWPFSNLLARSQLPPDRIHCQQLTSLAFHGRTLVHVDVCSRPHLGESLETPGPGGTPSFIETSMSG